MTNMGVTKAEHAIQVASSGADARAIKVVFVPSPDNDTTKETAV